MRTHRRVIAARVDPTLAAVAEGAELWHGEWQPEPGGGRLVAPVLAGLRQGRLEATVRVEPLGNGSGTELTLTVVRADYRLHRSAVAVLIFALAAAVVAVLWPWYPRLLPLVPATLIIALSTWFLVLSRIQNRGPEEFLALVVELAEQDPAPPTAG